MHVTNVMLNLNLKPDSEYGINLVLIRLNNKMWTEFFKQAHKHSHGQKNVECSICKMKFKSNAALALHKVKHSDEKRYKCTYCPNGYKRSDALKVHLSTHTGIKQFQCLFCERAFNNGANRRKHILRDHPLELAAHEAQKDKNQELQVQ